MAQKATDFENWTDTAEFYAEKIEKVSLSAGLTLSRMVRLSKAKNIIEVGSGPGILTLYWLKTLPAGVKYTSVDISEEMVKIARGRKEEQKHQLNNIEHEFTVGDAHDLKSIPNESMDVYIAPLLYCHIADPKKAFSEANRVLKKGGRIGVSMGLPQNNSFQAFWKNAMAKVENQSGEHDPKKHHHHAISGKEHLLQLAQEAGFEVEYCWEQDTVFDILDENDAADLVQMPGWQQMYKNLSEENKKKFVEALKTEFVELKKTQTPLRFFSLFLTGRKPE